MTLSNSLVTKRIHVVPYSRAFAVQKEAGGLIANIEATTHPLFTLPQRKWFLCTQQPPPPPQKKRRGYNYFWQLSGVK